MFSLINFVLFEFSSVRKTHFRVGDGTGAVSNNSFFVVVYYSIVLTVVWLHLVCSVAANKDQRNMNCGHKFGCLYTAIGNAPTVFQALSKKLESLWGLLMVKT